ncbi:MAG: DNA primase [Clostridia bacterium]|nr:DNA primase [Clostridia bacterium]
MSVADYVKFIGIETGRNGKIICPFHDDRNPSMQVDRGFYCYGCGEKGDVIDFVSKYYGISVCDAAKRISAEFGLSEDNTLPPAVHKESEKEMTPREKKSHLMQYLISVEKELNNWLKEYAPGPDDEELHFLFASASKNIGYVGYLIDTLIECITDEEINKFILQHKGEILL